MNAEELKKHYGDEYPAAIMFKDHRIPLTEERPFSRFYSLDEENLSVQVSRFMDGSASITAADLQIQWPRWTENERHDFCFGFAWLSRQSDFPDMVRFIMQHGGREDWTAIALDAAGSLPKEEAFDLLLRVLNCCEPEHTANITQAIVFTRHPRAESVLRDHLEVLWQHERLWEDASFINWVGFSTITCIAHLIELGAPTTDFTEKVRQLSTHTCSRNRESCSNFLAKHYSQLEPPTPSKWAST